MREHSSLVCVVLALAACQGPTVPPSQPVQATNGVQTHEPLDVSIYRLLATPENLDGKRVRVIGYLHLAFEGNSIYAHKADYDQSIHQNGFWIDVTRCERVGGTPTIDEYVLVEARFSSIDRGHLDIWSGALTQVTRCVSWPGRNPTRASNNSFKPTPLRGAA